MAFRFEAPTIPLDALQWDDIGEAEDPKARLLAHICIGPLNMHLEAWAITEDGEGIQAVVSESSRTDDFDRMCTMMDCTFQTVEIEGREYFLIATPYGN